MSLGPCTPCYNYTKFGKNHFANTWAQSRICFIFHECWYEPGHPKHPRHSVFHWFLLCQSQWIVGSYPLNTSECFFKQLRKSAIFSQLYNFHRAGKETWRVCSNDLTKPNTTRKVFCNLQHASFCNTSQTDKHHRSYDFVLIVWMIFFLYFFFGVRFCLHSKCTLAREKYLRPYWGIS